VKTLTEDKMIDMLARAKEQQNANKEGHNDEESGQDVK
jgi:hypothetical protein